MQLEMGTNRQNNISEVKRYSIASWEDEKSHLRPFLSQRVTWRVKA